MTSTIYKEIRKRLIALNLAEAVEYFDIDNIPDSLIDKHFFLGIPSYIPGERFNIDTEYPIFNLQTILPVNLCRKLPVNKIQEFIISTNIIMENIIKSVLSTEVGGNEIDKIDFAGSDSVVSNGIMIIEIRFNVNYRIDNL